jgi:hypothetical protein
VALGAVAFASSPPLHPIPKLLPTLLFLSIDEKALTDFGEGIDYVRYIELLCIH